jgi:hypothetical protein
VVVAATPTVNVSAAPPSLPSATMLRSVTIVTVLVAMMPSRTPATPPARPMVGFQQQVTAHLQAASTNHDPACSGDPREMRLPPRQTIELVGVILT